MPDIFTDEQIASALLSLKTPRITEPITNKQRKTLIKEKRAQGLKAWQQMQRKMKEKEATKYRNRSNAMKAAWAQRKTTGV